MFCPAGFSAYPWMEYAVGELGVRETAGKRTTSNIASYLATVGLSGAGDETPWCSAFANWCMIQAGIPGTGRGNARSWLDWGGLCLGAPVYGCVVILWRGSPSSWQGHVGFYTGGAGGSLTLLGGNQSDSVCYADFPRTRVLGYRWPAELPVPSHF